MAILEDEIVNDSVGREDVGGFLGDMTEEEYEEYDLQENRGWKGFYKKINNLGK